MRRSSVSISSNIAEGDQLDSDKSSIRHFKISKGSAAELFTQSIISDRIGYLEKQDFDYLIQECKEILSMLSGLIKHRIQLDSNIILIHLLCIVLKNVDIVNTLFSYPSAFRLPLFSLLPSAFRLPPVNNSSISTNLSSFHWINDATFFCIL